MDELFTTITDIDPDLILLVEYTPEQHKYIYPLLKEKYPYSTTNYLVNGIGGKVIYAKYPFTNLAPELEGDARRRYGHISLEYASQTYLFYVTHTTAPIHKKYFLMRNRQIEQLARDVLDQNISDDTHVLVMGDFNLTPWSPVYHKLEKTLGKIFTNIVSFIPGVMTWSLFESK